MDPEALSLIEFSSIAAGTRAVDALIKKAPVKVERVGTLQPGKMAVLFTGDVASVEASHGEAMRMAAGATHDDVFLPFVEVSVYRAAVGAQQAWDGDTLGVLESKTMAGAIHASDVALKGANVRILEMRLGDELGGGGIAHVIGEQHDVEAAVELALERASGHERELRASVTPRLDDDLRAMLSASTKFWRGSP
jgi:microcompartment protein CcmL/EutN